MRYVIDETILKYQPAEDLKERASQIYSWCIHNLELCFLRLRKGATEYHQSSLNAWRKFAGFCEPAFASCIWSKMGFRTCQSATNLMFEP